MSDKLGYGTYRKGENFEVADSYYPKNKLRPQPESGECIKKTLIIDGKMYSYYETVWTTVNALFPDRFAVASNMKRRDILWKRLYDMCGNDDELVLAICLDDKDGVLQRLKMQIVFEEMGK